jgi:hypothetical protein
VLESQVSASRKKFCRKCSGELGKISPSTGEAQPPQQEFIAPNRQENPQKGREAAAPSFIKEIQEVQDGQETPHDGDAIIPKSPDTVIE